MTDMKSYLLPTKSRSPENIVLHCGTNDLKKEKSANEISNYIIEVALLCKSDNNNVLDLAINMSFKVLKVYLSILKSLIHVSYCFSYFQLRVICVALIFQSLVLLFKRLNPLMPGGNKKVTHT